MKQLTKHFSEDEFKCSCCGAVPMDKKFMEKLEQLRLAYGKSMIITSGYRCSVHNVKIGGSKSSKHMEGIAADIKISSGSEAYQLIKLAIGLGFTGIGVAKTFLHLDTRTGTAVTWVY